MPLISLLSDWGQEDHYLAEVKLRLYTCVPDCRILDISHGLKRNDLLSADFMISDLLPSMPEGSVHIIGIQDISSEDYVHVAARAGSQFIIGTDSGFFEYFQWISGRKVDEVRLIGSGMDAGGDSCTFPSRDFFPEVAARLIRTGSLDGVGVPGSLSPKVMASPMAVKVTEKDREGNAIGCRLNGKVLYVDHFGNACTNIRKSQYQECLSQYPFTCMTVNGKRLSKPPVRSYQDVAEGSLLGLFLKNGFLEVSINGDRMADLLGFGPSSQVNILFGQSLFVW